MKKIYKGVLITFFAMAAGLSVEAKTYHIVPTPNEVSTSQGQYRIKKNDASKEAKLITDASLAPESYRLVVGPDKISIYAADARGHFYGLQTLRQLIAQSENGMIDCMTINDAPRYGYRGVMLDVVRCYLEPQEIKKIIDAAAMLKFNTLHLHLTDDNGWRMEIKKYPRLTDVGAWRVDRPEIFPGRLNARSADEAATYGGFYTQAQLRDLVKYAAKRHITIIPEIEMPAHSAAAIASYPELGCPVVDKFVGVFPGIGGKDASIILCAGKEETFTFYQNVLDEMMEVFPSHYIHLGGDEADKTMWHKCNLCQERIKNEGLSDCEELQAYFMDRINHYVHNKGRATMGWDEVTYGNPKEDMVIMGWQGDGSVAVKDAVKSGRKFIMTPARTLYLIRYQGPQWFEPFTYFGNNTLLDIHKYAPLNAEMEKAVGNQLLGVQGSMWTEFCRTPEDVQYMMFPRLLAVADVAWRNPETACWQSFLKGVDAMEPLLNQIGIKSARSMYNLDHYVRPNGDGTLSVAMSNIRPDMELKFSFDNNEMGNTYSDTLKVAKSTTLNASTFNGDEQMGKTLTLPLQFNKSTGHNVKSQNCNNGLQAVLTNGLRGSDRNSDFEWAGWYNANAEFVVDLGKSQHIEDITLGTLVHADICVASPRAVYVYLSDDGQSWNYQTAINIPEKDLFNPQVKIMDLNTGHIGKSAQYIKIFAINPGCIPDGYAREGRPAWMYFDELQVR